MDTEAINLQHGDYLDYTPAAPVVAGQVVQAGGRAGICASAIGANVKGAVQVKGIIKVKAAAISGNVGDPIGWDENGTPVGGTATGAATTTLSAADFIIGSLVAALADTDGVAQVALNEIIPSQPSFEGLLFEEITDDKTMDAEDCGKAFIITVDAKTITLPATANGLGPMVFINGGKDAAVIITLSPAAADKIMGPDIPGTADKDLINTKLTAKHWDYVILRPDVAGAGWSIDAMRGIWATQG